MSKKKWIKKAELCVIAGDKKMNELMSTFDQTDNGRKVFATPVFYTVTLSNARTRKYIVDALRMHTITTKTPCAAIFFTDSEEASWVNPSIRTVSDGTKWFLVKEFMYAQWNANGLGSKKNG